MCLMLLLGADRSRARRGIWRVLTGSGLMRKGEMAENMAAIKPDRHQVVWGEDSQWRIKGEARRRSGWLTWETAAWCS